MSSTWKNNIEITIFGESHGKAVSYTHLDVYKRQEVMLMIKMIKKTGIIFGE